MTTTVCHYKIKLAGCVRERGNQKVSQREAKVETGQRQRQAHFWTVMRPNNMDLGGSAVQGCSETWCWCCGIDLICIVHLHELKRLCNKQKQIPIFFFNLLTFSIIKTSKISVLLDSTSRQFPHKTRKRIFLQSRRHEAAADVQNPNRQWNPGEADMLYAPRGDHPPHSSVSPNWTLAAWEAWSWISLKQQAWRIDLSHICVLIASSPL